ncbi:MAG TPA: hypothetical protein VFA45_25335 [Actinomycetes bacterium]|nr:hypothetical protein [Actinomycetes bacterium]
MPSATTEHHPEGSHQPDAPATRQVAVMPPRRALRIGAVAAVGGGTLALAGNILHPREPGQLDDAESLLAVAARSDIWVIDHLVILIAVTLLLLALYALSRSFTGEPARSWARFAWAMAAVGGVFALALMLAEATAMAALADTWANGSGTERDVALAAGSAIVELSLTLSVGGMLFLFGAAPLLFGLAMLNSDDYGPWLGWVGVLFGSLGVVTGVMQVLTRLATLTQFVLFPIAAVAITLWIVYLGVLMWRKSRHAGAETAGSGWGGV